MLHDYEQLKKSVLKYKNIKKTDGYYRFISREHKIMTSGFLTRTNLLKYRNDFRFDKSTIEIMRERYQDANTER